MVVDYDNAVARLQEVIRKLGLVPPQITSFEKGVGSGSGARKVCLTTALDFKDLYSPFSFGRIKHTKVEAYCKGCVPEGPMVVKVFISGKEIKGDFYTVKNELYVRVVITPYDEVAIGFFNTSSYFDPTAEILEVPKIKVLLEEIDTFNRKRNNAFILVPFTLLLFTFLNIFSFPLFIILIFFYALISIVIYWATDKTYDNVFGLVLPHIEDRASSLRTKASSLVKMKEEDPRIDEELEKINKEISRLENFKYRVKIHKECKGFYTKKVNINPGDLLEYKDIVTKLDYDEAYKELK